MNTFTTTKAVIVAIKWHGGNWSALYQFGSSGLYHAENHLRYLQEVEDCLHPEYHLLPGYNTQAADKELNQLKRFFTKNGELHGIKTTWKQHPVYGYNIPVVSSETADAIAKKIVPLKYLI